MNLLWNTRINLRQKLALVTLFSLTAITMVFSIVRVEVALRGAREDDSWFYVCTTLELTIGWSFRYFTAPSYIKRLTFRFPLAIIITCIVSYRSLFTTDLWTGSSRRYWAGATPLQGNLSMPYTEVTTERADRKQNDSSSTVMHEEPEVLPLDVIRVRNDYTVQSHA